MPADSDPFRPAATHADDGTVPDGSSSGGTVIVDDRLDTVLRTVAAGPAGLRVQFRQLADLLGRVGDRNWTARHDAALDRLDAILDAVASAPGGLEGADTLLAGTPLLRARLVARFAAGAPRRALAAIRAARLDEASWLALIPQLPIQARGFLRHRRDLSPAVVRLLEQLGIDDFALTAPMAVAEPVETPEAVAAAEPESSPAPEEEEGIGAIVRRIEAFRRDREVRTAGPADLRPLAAAVGDAGTPGDPDPRLPFAEDLAAKAPPLAIDICLDATGTLCDAEAELAPMLVGHRPFTGATHAPARADAASCRAFAAHRPITAGLVTFDGAAAIAGAWRIDAVPVFAPAGGAFAGYRARLRRLPPGVEAQAADPAPAAREGADRLRQTLHELRTPINAIQGFAEMIQQQVFGATPHQYRSLAASIAADAARMLAGFEDLERLARLETGQADIVPETGPGTDLVALVARLVAQLDPVIGPREVRLRWSTTHEPLPVAVSPLDLEHTVWRLLAVMAGTAAPGERMTLALERAGTMARLSLPLPAALAMRDDATLFAADSNRGGTLGQGGMMGNGFALRLASAEVRAMGGALQRDGAHLRIELPLAAGLADADTPADTPTDTARRAG